MLRNRGVVGTSRLRSIGLLVLALVVSPPAFATILSSTSNLPPDPEPADCETVPSHHVGIDVYALFPNGIDMSNARFFCFRNVSIVPDPPTGDEYAFFDADLEATLDNGSGPRQVTFQGPVQFVYRGKGPAQTGSWQTEIISMDLSGDIGGIPVQIRVSPLLPTQGQTTVQDAGNAQFLIDSFFDVFTELSVAGGPFERQIGGPARITLERVVPGGAIVDRPGLPPEPDPLNCDRLVSRFVGDLLSLWPNGIDFSNPKLRCFEDVLISTHAATGDETQDFDMLLEGAIDDGSGPQPVVLSGPAKMVARGKSGASTGAWDTEILSLSLSGDVGGVSIEIRESPSLPSPGRARVEDIGGGEFQIDSFFDVFTELSIDGGPFQPQTNPAGRVELERIRPEVELPSPGLPPEPDPPSCERLASRYLGPHALALFPNGIAMTDLVLECFENVQRSVAPGTGDETETFGARLLGMIDDGSGPQPVVMSGPAQMIARGKGGASTGSWDIEMVSMNLAGNVGGIPIEIRESPSLPSPGETRVQDNGDGTFNIDSFFDVFFEISVAGGPFQLQASTASRLELNPTTPTALLRNSKLPPEADPPNCDRLASHYVGNGLQALFPNGIDLSDTVHECFQLTQRTIDPATGDEDSRFDAIVEGSFDDGSGPQRVVMSGPVRSVARSKGGASTGSWETEILSMDLSGDVGGVSIEIRESPSLPSPGETRVRDDGQGHFIVDSFFDVFTELSIDGGPFQPQVNGAGRSVLEPIRPSVDLPTPNLPPEPNPTDCNDLTSRYEGQDEVVLWPNGIAMSRLRHECFENVSTSTDPTSGDETGQFDAVLTAIFDDGSGPQLVPLSGPVEVLVKGKGGSTTGSWDTEMVSMSLSGDVGGVSIEIRESPSLPSPGATRVTDNGDGTFNVDSFFDVFFEISIDGGPFQPQTSAAARIDLVRVRPSVILPSPALPPEPNPADCSLLVSAYTALGTLSLFPNGIDLSDPKLDCFENVSTSTDPTSGDETQDFDAILEGVFDDGSGPQATTLSGPVRVLVKGKGSGTTGSWDTEMISMSLSGSVGGIPIEIRESPGRPSPGETRVDDLGGGQFEIDSFFDVFTELSIAGGPFQPQTNQATRIELPEPGRWLMLLAAVPLLYWMGERRGRKH